MTELDKLIASQADDTIISVGSKSGFVFVGTKAEWLQDVDKLSESLLAGMIRTARRAQRDYKRLYAAAVKAASEGTSPAKDLTASAVNKLKTYLEYTVASARFVPLRQRSVKESYGGIEAGTLKVIVPGDEYGDYWLRDEVRPREGKAVITPCAGCIERVPGCHASCERYAAWRRSYDAICALQKRNDDADSYCTEWRTRRARYEHNHRRK